MMRAVTAQSGEDDGVQKDVIAFLSDPVSHERADHVDCIETHGNLVFLAGDVAWKIKRAVRLPYMDFSTLEKRHEACVREIEINRWFGSPLYLGCVPIVRPPGGRIAFGGAGVIVEWAVRMRRFDQAALLSSIAQKGKVTGSLARDVADAVYDTHRKAQRAAKIPGSAIVLDLAKSVSRGLCGSIAAGEQAERLACAMVDEASRIAATLDERAAEGFVRRCHGDLHLANIVLWQGRPTPYDAIEFDENLATVDVLHDLAFVLMDLDRYGQRTAANAVLNRYLQRSDAMHLKGLVTLPLFLALRAAVRALVSVDRAAQQSGEERERRIDAARDRICAALGYLQFAPAQLLAVGGLSGTGKTAVASAIAPWIGRSPGAVHLRTDIERKRLAEVDELQRLPAASYSPESRRNVYRVLRDKAIMALEAGQSVIVDAVFAETDARQQMQSIAGRTGARFCGLWLQADLGTLMKRIEARHNDASDATPEVVSRQFATARGPLTAEWSTIQAGGTLQETLAAVRTALSMSGSETHDDPQP